jgi:hypothetical protein
MRNVKEFSTQGSPLKAGDHIVAIGIEFDRDGDGRPFAHIFGNDGRQYYTFGKYLLEGLHQTADALGTEDFESDPVEMVIGKKTSKNGRDYLVFVG